MSSSRGLHSVNSAACRAVRCWLTCSIRTCVIEKYLINIYIFFPSGVKVSLSSLRFSTLLHNDPAVHQDPCGRCRIRTWNPCPRSLRHYTNIHIPYKHKKMVSKFLSLVVFFFVGHKSFCALVFFSKRRFIPELCPRVIFSTSPRHQERDARWNNEQPCPSPHSPIIPH